LVTTLGVAVSGRAFLVHVEGVGEESIYGEYADHD
jgi:hypothetical protein